MAFCIECGRKLPDSTYFCGKCGTQLPISAKFCGNCGTPVQVEPSSSKPEKGKQAFEDDLA